MRKIMKLLTGVILSVALIGSVAAFAACGDSDEACSHDSLTKVEAVAATTDSEGNIEYWYCSDCGKYFSDSAATKEISKSDTVIAKLTETDNGDNGEVSVVYQYQAYCYSHSAWGLVTLYSDDTFLGYSFSSLAGDSAFKGTWVLEESKWYSSITLSYTQILDPDTLEVTYEGTNGAFTTAEAIADEDGNFAFGVLILPVYRQGYGPIYGCQSVDSELTTQIWTDVNEWYESVKDTVVDTTEALIELTGTPTDESDENAYVATFYDDNSLVIKVGEQGMQSTGTWSYSADEGLSISMDGSATVEFDKDAEEGIVFTYSTSMTGSYDGHEYEISYSATFSLTEDDLSTLAPAVVATFTGDTEGYSGELYDDGTGILTNPYYDTEVTWSYSNGTFTVIRKSTDGNVTLETAIDTTAGTATVTFAPLGTTVVFTCTDISGIIG